MAWTDIDTLSPFEDWQISPIPIARNVEFFRLTWSGPQVPRMLNLIGQSANGEIFQPEKTLSDDPPAVVRLICPPFWTERAIAMRCPKVWRSTLSSYVVTISAWID